MSRNKYETHVKPNLNYITSMARHGAIDKDIAHNLNVAESTFSSYKNKYPELVEALAVGKDEADAVVESALFKNATGFTYLEEQSFKCKKVFYDDEGRRCEEEELKSIFVERFRPGETAAQCFWLKNRRPDLWRDKQDIELSGTVSNPMEGLTTKQVEALANAEIKDNKRNNTKRKDRTRKA